MCKSAKICRNKIKAQKQIRNTCLFTIISLINDIVQKPQPQTHILQSNDTLPTNRMTARTCHEGLFSDFSKTDLLTCDGKMAMVEVYTVKHV